MNYNKIIREPLTEKTKVPVEEIIREPMIESSPTKEEGPLSAQVPTNAATVVCPSHLNVRESANILSRVVAILKTGDVVVVEGVQDDWTRICTSSGIEGYSISEYVVPTPVE